MSLVASHSGAEVAAIDAAVPFVERFSEEAEADDDVRPRRDAAPRDPRGRGERAAVGVAGLPRLGRAGRRHPRAARRRLDRAARPHARGASTAPATAPPTRSSSTPSAGCCWPPTTCSAHISSNPLITRPRDGSTERPQALVTYLESLAGHARDGPGPGAARPRRPDHRPPLADRRALRAAPPPGREAARPDRRAAAQRLRAGPGAVGQHRRDPGLPHAQRGARPHRHPARRGPGARGRGRTASCASRRRNRAARAG